MRIHQGFVDVLIQVRVISPHAFFYAGSLSWRAGAGKPSPQLHPEPRITRTGPVALSRAWCGSLAPRPY